MKISQDIRQLVPYKPGKPISETQREYGLSNVLKLASNENPLGPSPRALEAIQKELCQLHRYPDPTFYDLLEKLSQKNNWPKSGISLGNGSNEIIDLLIRIFCEPGQDSILVTEAAFVAYPVCAQAAHVETHRIPMAKGMKTDLKAMSDFLKDKTNPKASTVRLVFLPNPNNPTGTYLSSSEVELFLKETQLIPDLLVVFDEAYHEFVRTSEYQSALESFIHKYPHVVVLRTFSKAFGLAGLRLGVMYASNEIVEIYNRVRNTFNVNHLAQVGALAALDDIDFVNEVVELTSRGMDQVCQELSFLGLPYTPSQGNFVLFDTLRDALQVNEILLRKGIILRPVGNYGFPRHLRMTIGTESDNQKAIEALKEAIKEIKAC